MVSSKFSAAAVALAAARLAVAQTHTLCSPMKKDCPDVPAFGNGEHVIDFTKGSSDEFVLAAGTTLTYDGPKGAVFTISKEGNAPTISSNKFLMFGSVEVITQAAFGAGIVTSVVLQADDLDEIDWEWIGNDYKQVQTNYFSKGDDSTFDRGGYHNVANPQTTFNNYTIDWTKDYVRWYINGAQVRELKYADAKGGKTFPQSPCQVKIGTWIAGRKDAPKGTVEWAGGYTDFAQGPFLAYYQTVKVRDYQKGESGAKAYHYGDRSGTWESVQVLKDGSSTGPKPSSSGTVAPSSSSSAPTSSDAPTSSATTLQPTPSPSNTGVPGGANNNTSTGGPRPTGTGANPANPGQSAPPSAGVRSAVSFAGLAAAVFLSSLLL